MQSDAMGMVNAIMPMVVMGAIFYFMLWRPQKQQQNKRQQMLEALKVGDKVITVGGMLGEIVAIDDHKVTLKLAENVEIEFLRTAVSHLQTDLAKAE